MLRHLKPDRRKILAGISLLSLCLILTGLTAWTVKIEVEREAENEFDFICLELANKLTTRLHAHAQLLRSNAAIFEAVENVTRAQWRAMYQRQLIQQNLPGILGVGYAVILMPDQLTRHEQAVRAEGFPAFAVKPAGKRDIYTSIIYLEPFAGRNLRAFGYDMYSEPIRRAAMEYARDNDIPSLTGKITLVQETKQDVQPGTIMLVPVYQPGKPHETVEQRRKAIIGWVYSPYRMNDLMKGILGGYETVDNKNIRMKIFDNAAKTSDALLYDNKLKYDTLSAAVPIHERDAIISFNDKQWFIQFSQYSSSNSRIDYAKVWSIAGGGGIASFLVFLLYLSFVSTKVRARNMAEKLTRELRDSEAKYSIIFRNGIYAIAIFKQNTFELIDVNERLIELYGYSREELLGGMTILNLSNEPEKSKILINRITEEGTSFIPLRYHLKKNGQIIPVQIVGGLYKWRGEDVIFILIQDISERKAAEDKLVESETRFKNMFERHNAVMLLIDTDSGMILDANHAAQKFYGYGKEDLLAKRFSDLDARTETKTHGRLITDGISSVITQRLRNGEIRKVEVHAAPIEYFGKKISFSIIYDVTERVMMEELVIQTRYNYETFFNTIDELLFVLDEAGTILHVNETVVKRLGYSREELYGHSVLMVHPPERRDEVSNIVQGMLAGLLDFCPVPVIAKNGTPIPVETRVRAGEWDNKPALFGVTKDISRIWLSEEKFSKVFYVNPSACGLSDLQTGEYLEVNEAFSKLFGYSAGEVIGKTAAELGIMLPETRKLIMMQIGSDGKINDAEADLYAKDGSVKHVLLSAEDIKLQDRRVRFTVVHDITSIREAERAVAALAARHKAILRASSDGVHLLDSNGFVVEVNDAFCLMLGYTREEILGMNVTNWDMQWSPDELLDIISRLIDNPAIFESRHKRKDGSVFDVEINSVGLELDGKRYLYNGARDITARKQAADALRSSNQKLEGIIYASPDGIGVISLDGRLELISDKLAEIYGYTSDEKNSVLGRYVFDFIDPAYQAQITKRLQKLLTGDADHQISDYLAIRKDGSRFFVDLNSTLLLDAAGNPESILFIQRDITRKKLAEEALRESEEKHRVLFSNSPDAYLIIIDGVITDCNKSAEELFGLGNNSIIGQNIASISPELQPGGQNSAILAQQKMNNALNIGKQNYEWVYLRAGDTEFTADISLAPMRVNGAPALFAALRDITQRKAMQEELAIITSRLQMATRAVGFGVWDYDIDSGKLVWDDQMFLLFGINQNEFSGNYEAWNSSLHPDDRNRSQEELRLAIDGVKDFDTAFRIIRPDGGVRSIRAQALVLRDSSGRPHQMIGMNWDITAEREYEEKLIDRERYLQALFNIMGSGILIIKPDTCIIENANPAASRMIGIPAGELIGLDSTQFLQYNPGLVSRQTDSTGVLQNVELALACADGTKKNVIVSIFPMIVEGKDLLIQSFMDISELKQKEDELTKAINELRVTKYELEERAAQLAAANTDLEDARVKADAANVAKTLFIANVSHEIRTPMNAILGFSEILLSRTEDELAAGYLQTIISSGKALLHLINDILDLSKVEAGKMELRAVPINLRILIQEIIYLFVPNAQQRQIQLQSAFDPKLPITVLLDEIRLRQVLVNIIGNALKFTTKGFVNVKVTVNEINYESSRLNLSIAVEDSGIGVAKENQRLIFDAFSQVASSETRNISGTGLGLTISNRLVKLLGGSISLKSELGRGSIFDISLFNIEFVSESAQQNEKLITKTTGVRFEKRKFLVVDDVKQNIEVLKGLLWDQPFEFIEAGSGTEAVEKATSENPDLILMDIRMPGMDGVQAARILRGNESTANMPIIAFTASILDAKERSTFDVFDDFLIKPVFKNSLFDALMKVIPFKVNKAETPMADESVDCLASLTREQLDEAEEYLNNLEAVYGPKIDQFRSIFDLEEISLFAEELQTFCGKNKIIWFADYVDNLCFHLKSFNIAAVNESLAEFYSNTASVRERLNKFKNKE